jgi:hypothetical protein
LHELKLYSNDEDIHVLFDSLDQDGSGYLDLEVAFSFSVPTSCLSLPFSIISAKFRGRSSQVFFIAMRVM